MASTHRMRLRRRQLSFGSHITVGVAVALALALPTVAFGKASGPAAHVHVPLVQRPHRVAASPVRLHAVRLTQELRGLAAQFRTAGKHRAELSRRIVTVSRARQAAVLALVLRDPQAAGHLILPGTTRAVVAAIRGAQVETPVAVEGRHVIWQGERDSRPELYLDRLVTGHGRTFNLFGVSSQAKVRLTLAGADVPLTVRGFDLGGRLLATHISTPGNLHAAAAMATPATGQMTVAVIAGAFSGASAPDMAAIRANFGGNPGNDVDSFFSESSYGKMTLAPSFFGPYTLPGTTGTACSTDQTQAFMNAANADVDFTQFRRLIFVDNCPRGIESATSEGPVSTPDGTITAATIHLDPASASSLYPVAHEISHTLGSYSGHAGFYVCLPNSFAPPTRFGSGCTSDEYGDLYDVLGGGPYTLVSQSDPFHKAKAGWFTAANYPTVTTPGTSTYTLSPYELPSSGPLALNIPRGNSGTAFTVEYRQPIGFDSWMGSMPKVICPGPCTITQGASLRLIGSGSTQGGGSSDTQFIDTTPGSVPSAYPTPFEDETDGALLPGHTFTDPEYGIQITVVSADSTGLTLQVTIPPQTCVHASPTLTPVSPVLQSAAAGQTVTYTATLTNNDSGGCPSNTFEFTPPNSPTVQVVASPDYLKLAPGASATISLAVSALPTTLAGTYSFTALNGVGGGYFFSNSLGTSAAIAAGFSFQLTSANDTTPPSSPTSLSARALGARTVSLSWHAATDNVGVAGYLVKSSTGYQYTVAGTTFIDTYALPSSSYSYTVQAFDRRGNYSTAASVSVTTPAQSDYAAPTPPTVTADAGDHSLQIDWTPSTDNVGVAYYQLSPCLVANCIFPASIRSITVGGLPTRSRYDLRILAYDGDGNGSAMGGGWYTVYTAAAGTTAPSQPQQVISEAGSYRNLQLSWLPSSDDKGVDHYDIYRNNRLIASVPGTSYTDTNNITLSSYSVQAVDGDGSLSAPSDSEWFRSPSSSSADSTPPSATIQAPADSATDSGSVSVTTSVNDDVGVTRVELYVDGVKQATSTTAPYGFSWDTTKVADGYHWLFVRAYDAAGNYGTGGVTDVTVANTTVDTTAPTVTVSAPSPGAIVSGSVPLSATASDNVGVTRVDFAVDGTVVGTATSAPYGVTWNASTASAGSHTITATAYDAAGNATPASVGVTVAGSVDATAPTVGFGSPSSGANVSGTASVQANASDNVGVASVTLSVDGSVVGTDTASPWTFSVDTAKLANGTHTLSVAASDAAGNTSSAQESVNVQNSSGTGDTKAPSTPSGLHLAVAGTTQASLYWSPSTDNVGVAGYTVFRDGVQIAQTTVPDFFDTGLAPGTSHVYTVVAFDAAGNVSAVPRGLSVKTVAVSTATTGTLAGVVFSSAGKPLANVVVTLTGNGLTKTAKTSNSGVYKFTSLPAGTYTLTFAVTGAAAAATAGTPVVAVAGQTVVVASSS